MAEDPAARFMRAVFELATGTESVQERLSAAWLELMPLKHDDIPADLGPAFDVIEAEMLAAPEEPATLSDESAADAAGRILRLAAQLWIQGGSTQSPPL